MLSVPDGYIAISATSGRSYGSVMEADGPTSETKPDTNSKTSNASIEEVEDFSKDLVAPLRSAASAKSILKQSSSTDLDSQGSGKIKRAVSWHDFEGKNLHTVREFVPSENDDAELLFNPGEPKQCCVIC